MPNGFYKLKVDKITRETADADVRIDHRVQRGRKMFTLLHRKGEGGAAALFVGATAQQHGRHHRQQHERNNTGEQRTLSHRVHAQPPTLTAVSSS